ncbi:MAG: hypothetical protein VZS44_05780 [Bacilli bacterium]|nr:hypothetical protein [Bacilli bacterium]
MILTYKGKNIQATITTNPRIMRYKFQKLYYAIIINNCNKYSSIVSKQRIDVVMTDEDYNILSIKKAMHENTIYENNKAHKTILLPINYYNNLEKNTKFIIKK